METGLRVLFMANIPSPYRVDFFSELSWYCKLTVLFESDSASDREQTWLKREQAAGYETIFLKSLFRLSSSAFCPEVLSYLDPTKYDLIIVGVYSTPTGMYAIRHMKRHHIPYVINCDGGMAGKTTGIKAAIKRYFLSGAEGYLSTGSMCDDYLLSYGARKERIYRYPFTSVRAGELAPAVLTPEEKRERKRALQLPEDVPLILSVGQFIPRKGYDLLIRAAGSLKQRAGKETAQYCIIGGKVLPEYEEAMQQEGISRMQFMPFMDKETLRSYYEAADLFVLPTREDIWGLVINEAMAAGLPVITTTACVAGMEMLPQKEGMIVPPEDADALADAIYGCLERQEELPVFGTANLEAAKGYTIEEMARVHDEIFRDMLRKRGKRVLFVGTQVPDELELSSEHISAAGNRFQNNLIANMKKSGYAVESLGYLGISPGDKEKEKLLQGGYGDWTGVCAGIGMREKIRAMRRFLRMIRARLYDNDYVVCYNILYAWLTLPIWAKRNKTRSITVIADYSGPECYKSLPRKLYARLMKGCFRRFDTVVGLSENIRKYLRKKQTFLLMEGGVDRSLYTFFREPSRHRNDVYTVVYAGLLEKVTGIDLLLDAIRKLPASFAIRILFTGKGSMAEDIRELEKEDGRVSYLGHLPYEEYLGVIRDADVLINPRNMNLPENQNNFPSKVLEYLCSGKPVISTRFVGWEKFPHFLYTDSRAEKIANAMMEARDLTDHRQELFEKSRALTENYLWEKQIQRMLN